jgi:hypothetical protein
MNYLPTPIAAINLHWHGRKVADVQTGNFQPQADVKDMRAEIGIPASMGSRYRLLATVSNIRSSACEAIPHLRYSEPLSERFRR